MLRARPRCSRRRLRISGRLCRMRSENLRCKRGATLPKWAALAVGKSISLPAQDRINSTEQFMNSCGMEPWTLIRLPRWAAITWCRTILAHPSADPLRTRKHFSSSTTKAFVTPWRRLCLTRFPPQVKLPATSARAASRYTIPRTLSLIRISIPPSQSVRPIRKSFAHSFKTMASTM